MKYILDSNVLIEAKNEYYRFSFCSGYWDWILGKNDSDTVFIIDKVKSELSRGNDELSEWIKSAPVKLTIKPSPKLTNSLALIAQWVSEKSYSPAAKSVFLSSADYFIIAYAHSLGYAVVTRERPDPNSIRRVKIPDVCLNMGVDYISPFQLLEDEGMKMTCD